MITHPLHTDQEQQRIDNRLSVAMSALIFLVVGWLGGSVANAIPGNLLDNARLAFTNHYLSLSSPVDGPRTFYVMTAEVSKLVATLEQRPGIIRVEPTFMDSIAIVETNNNVTQLFNEIRRLPFVDTITSIPLFCH